MDTPPIITRTDIGGESFLDSSAPAALRLLFSCCGWFSGPGPLNQPQHENKRRAAKRRELKDEDLSPVSIWM
jgi:hypothetical protein